MKVRAYELVQKMKRFFRYMYYTDISMTWCGTVTKMKKSNTQNRLMFCTTFGQQEGVDEVEKEQEKVVYEVEAARNKHDTATKQPRNSR